MPAKNDIFFRRGASSNWSSVNPVLNSGEPGFDVTLKKLKIGDGVTPWNDLEWISVIGTSGEAIFPEAIYDVSGIFFDTSFGAVDQVEGQLNWNNETGTIDVGLSPDLTMHVGQDIFFKVKNSTGSPITKGEAVAATGVIGGGEVVQIAPFAVDGSIDEVRFIGLVADDIPNGGDGYVVNFGHVKNVDLRTSNSTLNPNGETWNVGDILFVDDSSAGGLTKVQPKDDIYVAMVLDDGQNGELLVRITDPGHISDLHDVNTNGVTNQQYLTYQSSTDTWIPTSSGIFTSGIIDQAIIGDIEIIDNTISSLSGDLLLYPECSGYVGINVDEPNSMLHVYSSVSGDSLFNVEGTYGSLFFVDDNLSGSIFSVNNIAGFPIFEVFSDDSVVAGRYGENDFVISSGGNVGIGTNAPNATLHVYSATSGDNVFNVEGTNGSLFGVTDSLSGVLMSVNTIAGLPVLEVNSDYSVTAGRFNQNDFVISSGGNVGIGTASPSYKLDVVGTGNFTGDLYVGDQIGIGTTNPQSGFKLDINGSSVIRGNILTNGAVQEFANVRFKLDPGANSNSYSYVSVGGGSFGVGTSTPTTKLDVSGVITATGGNSDEWNESYDWINASGVDGSGAANHIAYWSDSNSITYDASQLYWDSSNNRLGIGTSTPNSTLQVDGSILTIGGPNSTVNPFIYFYDASVWMRRSSTRLDMLGGNGIRLYTNTNHIGLEPNSAYGVGIGTFSPSQKLHVKDGNLRVENTTPVIEFHDTAAVGADISFVNDGLVLSHADVTGDNQLVIASNSGVGVGTDAPTATLHAYSPVPSSTVFNVEGTNGSLFSVVDNLSGVLMSVNNNAGLPVFEVYDDDSIIAGRFAQNDFVVSSGGDVGIGTDSPVSKLDVSGVITANGGDSDEWNEAYDWVQNSGLDGTGSASGIAFWTDTNSLSNDSSFVWDNANNRLGIGTASPSYSLDVNGAGRISNLLIAPGTNVEDIKTPIVQIDLYPNNTRSYSFTSSAFTVRNTRQLHFRDSNAYIQNTNVSGGDLKIYASNKISLEGSNVGINNSSPSYTLDIAGTANITGDVIVGGNVTVNGTTVSANVDTMEVADPILTLGLSSGNIVTNTNLDRGIALALNDGIMGFMGWDTSENEFSLLSSGVASNASGNYAPGTYGNLHIGGLIATTANFSSTIDAANLGAGVDNSVVILDSDGKLRTDEIDSRVWGTSLVDGGGVAGHVAFWTDNNTLSYDNNQLVWDSSNNRLGIGTSNPTADIQIGNIESNAPSRKLIITGYSSSSLDFNNHNGWSLHRFVSDINGGMYYYNDGTNNTTTKFNIGKVTRTNGELRIFNSSSSNIQMGQNDSYPIGYIGTNNEDYNYRGGLVFTTRESTSVTNQVYIDRYGHLGIGNGTNNPSTELDVSGVITATGGNSNEWNEAYDWIQASGLDGTGSASGVAFWTDSNTLSNDSALIWDSTNDRLGIGTNAPSSKLHILGGTTTTTVSSSIENASNFSGANDVAVLFTKGKNSTGTDILGVFGVNTSYTTASVGGIRVGSATNHSLSLATNNTERIRITSAGDVGIGTTSPSGTLHVVGDAYVDNLKLDGNTLSTTDTNGALILNPNGTGALQADAGGNARGTNAVDWQMVRATGTQVASGARSVIGGGSCNTASGNCSTVSGGYFNTATVTYSTVSGGYFNTASAYFSTVGGGANNTATNDGILGGATVAGGFYNTACGYFTTVSGGQSNCAIALYAFVGGGRNNTASGSYSTVSGGYNNCATSTYSTVGGGYVNYATGERSSVVGGDFNQANGCRSFVGAGYNNRATQSYSVVVGGVENCATCTYSFGGNGFRNCTSGAYGVINNGWCNSINSSTSQAAIVNGQQNCIAGGTQTFIGNGQNNSVYCCMASVVNGAFNVASGDYSAVVAGSGNTNLGAWSFIGGGINHLNNASYSTIGGGCNQYIDASYAVVAGGRRNCVSGPYGTVSGGYANSAPYQGSAVAGGIANRACACCSFVGGGYYSCTFGANSAIVGGFGNCTASGGCFGFIGAGNNNNVYCCYGFIGGGVLNVASGDYSAIVAGSGNIASGACSFIGGGNNHLAIGVQSTVAGGSSNRACGTSSFVGGGIAHHAIGVYSFVGGGKLNCAIAVCSTISGGYLNCAQGIRGTVGGGKGNSASGNTSTISGGYENCAGGDFSTVAGGFVTCATGPYSFVGGGYQNTASGAGSTVSGGRSNCACATKSSISGGCNNFVNARHGSINGGHYNVIQSPTNECCSRGATIGGGIGHNTSGGTIDTTTGDITGIITCCNAGTFSTIGGGIRNCVTGTTSTVSGGTQNYIQSGWSFIGGGNSNVACGNYSTIGGGRINTASGYCSTVSGGYLNCACGNYGSVGGGYNNTASGYAATIGGGQSNLAASLRDTVAGGISNTACGACSFVGGGCLNCARNIFATVGGGYSNDAAANSSTVGGGYDNTASGACSTVSGGNCNAASGLCSTVSGGYSNLASGASSTIAGGHDNTASGDCSTVGGGISNCSIGQHSSILGGVQNCACARSTVAGGHANWAITSDCYASIGGGYSNLATGGSSTIGGGYDNSATNWMSTVSGGYKNLASGACSTVSGGDNNCACGINSTIGGGKFNQIASGSCCATVAGGYANKAMGTCSTVGGGKSNCACGNESVVGGGSNNQALGTWSTISGGYVNFACGGGTVGGGYYNRANAGYSTIGGGQNNCALGACSTIAGGKSNTLSGTYSFTAGYSNNDAGYANVHILGSGITATQADTTYTQNIIADGHLAATTKSFLINHPTRPGHKLQYGSLESPYHGVRLTGRGKITSGWCVVKLPEYIRELVHDNEDVNIQLTNYRHGKTLYVSEVNVAHNEFTVKTDSWFGNDLEFYWSFTATRKDIDPLRVEY